MGKRRDYLYPHFISIDKAMDQGKCGRSSPGDGRNIRAFKTFNQKGSRMVRKIIPFFGLIFMGANCANIKYQQDTGFLNSAQANSPEFPALINGVLCKDSGGMVGLCSMRIKSNQDVSIHIDKRQYTYTLVLSCSSAIDESQSFTIGANDDFNYTIKANKFSTVNSFLCIGEVAPSDREVPISAEFEFRIKVVDAAYTPRESIYILKDKLVLGEHAKYVDICDAKGCRAYSEKPVVSFRPPVKAFSESYTMRFNYYGE